MIKRARHIMRVSEWAITAIVISIIFVGVVWAPAEERRYAPGTFTGQVIVIQGTKTIPSIAGPDTKSGIYFAENGQTMFFSINDTLIYFVNSGGITLNWNLITKGFANFDGDVTLGSGAEDSVFVAADYWDFTTRDTEIDAGSKTMLFRGFYDFTNALDMFVPDANAPTEVMNQQTCDARYVQTRSPITVMFGGGTDPHADTNSATYTTIGIFLFGGTTALGTPTAMKAIGFKDATPTSWDFRIQDITNATTIVEKTGNTGTVAEIVDSGALSNLPAAEAIFEVQLKRTGGTGSSEAHIYSLTTEF